MTASASTPFVMNPLKVRNRYGWWWIAIPIARSWTALRPALLRGYRRFRVRRGGQQNIVRAEVIR